MKRPSAKGKGADIFFSESEATLQETTEQKAVTPRAAELGTEETVEKQKASSYFTMKLLDDQDRTWMQLRMQNRKLTKSEFVQTAIEEMLQEYQHSKENSRLYQRLVDLP